MMALLWAQQIMSQETLDEAKEMYARVPRLLKEKVKKILVDSGMEEITEQEAVGIYILRKKVITWHAEKEKAAEKAKVDKEIDMRETRARPQRYFYFAENYLRGDA